MTEATGVLLVDEQDLIRAGLAALIDAAPGLRAVGQASTGQEAVAQAAALHPDVVLMDIHMPGVDGAVATELILTAAASRGERSRVLILTASDMDEYVRAALGAGASGFLHKQTHPDRLLAAIRAVASGDKVFSPAVAGRLVEAYIGRPVSARRASAALAALTPRELDVLRHVGRGATNTEIAEYFMISESTVKTHLSRTLAKLGVTTRAQAVVVAYETGLIAPGPEAVDQRAHVPADREDSQISGDCDGAHGSHGRSDGVDRSRLHGGQRLGRARAV
ncbi:DNA-binding NarL/FixJ family response regulator [Catenulispora sp. EB89]|uniref:response regulator n=1 Tax=Catenulispora sp. EB89 TaxID=3156257 RepID=UPI0035147068